MKITARNSYLRVESQKTSYQNIRVACPGIQLKIFPRTAGIEEMALLWKTAIAVR
jgi:hypothetical protein